ncbi:MAG TPA: cob(I)yrinic acid a,c-diamide adenosyltransferase [Actinomycetes bacterium]|nr:cob(I)yrinic acid a,c-diamide adenosyltransferase [Actinomycetes bacterium]
MVNLTRIYTRTGDDGTTSLGDMSRTDKNDLRLRAYADVDEANSAIGYALSLGRAPTSIAEVLHQVQNDLFDVGADLCTPVVADPAVPPLRVTQEYVDALETACDEHNERLEKLRSFVLPGGTPTAAALHVARTVVRRAERATWAALAQHEASMNPLTARYLNRLSDLLFILAREANSATVGGPGDVLWRPGARGATAQPAG